jgi:hypothetical protein
VRPLRSTPPPFNVRAPPAARNEAPHPEATRGPSPWGSRPAPPASGPRHVDRRAVPRMPPCRLPSHSRRVFEAKAQAAYKRGMVVPRACRPPRAPEQLRRRYLRHRQRALPFALPHSRPTPPTPPPHHTRAATSINCPTPPLAHRDCSSRRPPPPGAAEPPRRPFS